MALDNVPIEQRARKLGHSLEMHNSIYGRWDTEKELSAVGEAFGVKRKKVANMPIICPFCEAVNESGREYCLKCSNPLTTAVAVRDKAKQESQNESVQQQLDEMKKMMLQVIKEKDKTNQKDLDKVEKIFEDI
jgi:hypothetical protein